MSQKTLQGIRISDSVSRNLKVFKYFGFWTSNHFTSTQKWLYRIYGACIITIFFYLYTLSYTIDVLNSMAIGNLEKFSKGSFLLLTLLAEIDRLDEETFQPKTVKHLELITTKMDLVRGMFTLFMVMYEGTVSLWAVFPLFDTKNKINLPLSGWYPYSTEGNFEFICTYFYQIIGCVYLACLNCCLDIFIAGMMVNVTAQLDILLDKLQFGGEVVDEENYDPEVEERNVEFLKMCAIHHEEIIRFVADFEKIFTFSVLFQFSTSALIICITMFHMTLVNPLTVEFLSMLIYQSCMLMQLFLYCWFGNEIMLKSDKVSEACYFSNWCRYQRGIKYGRSLQLIMIRSKRPIKITAGYFFPLSIVTFSKILRSAWSYFALLQRVHSRDI